MPTDLLQLWRTSGCGRVLGPVGPGARGEQRGPGRLTRHRGPQEHGQATPGGRASRRVLNCAVRILLGAPLTATDAVRDEVHPAAARWARESADWW
ncbi:hypothetical protein WJ438_39105 [Streptomyces sp. GD-15H]|uniref:hypothetical protein n=1 Tax=Streptomyces sp. GD-15H TaxID=3129112 RepID=UPI0032556474